MAIQLVPAAPPAVPQHLYAYPLLASTTPTQDTKALANRAAMLELIVELKENLGWATNQGQGKYQAQHLKRGMMLGASFRLARWGEELMCPWVCS